MPLYSAFFCLDGAKKYSQNPLPIEIKCFGKTINQQVSVQYNVRRLAEYAAHERNSMWDWPTIKSPLRVALNYLVIRISGFLPSLRIKNALYRSIGIKLGKNVSVGLEVTFDIFFPELIEIGDNTVIGYRSTLLCHEFLVSKWKKGPLKIGDNVMIGANTTVLAGVVIESGATISACSLVNGDVAGRSFVGGVPAKEIRSESAT